MNAPDPDRECDGNNDNYISTRELGWAMRVMGFNPTELGVTMNSSITDIVKY